MMRKLLVVWVVALLVPTISRAQGLESAVPGDAIVYVGWAGADGMGEGYEGSHLEAVLEASQMRQVFTDFLPKLLQRIGREEREAAPVAELVTALAEPMWKYPTAVYFGGVDTTDARNPVPQLAIYMQAGGEAARLAQRVNAAVAKLGQLPFAVTAVEQGGVLVAAVGELPAGAGSLAQNEAYKAAMEKVGGAGVLTFYMDVERLVALGDRLAAGNGGDAEPWNAVKTGLNLAGIRRIAGRSGFDGRDWVDMIFIDAPSPRTGLAALFDVQAMGAEALEVIPQDATLAAAGRFDLSRVMQEVRSGLQRVDPQMIAQLEEGLATIAEETDVDLEKDLVDAMGDQWAFYAAPSVGGDGLMGFAMVNKLDDPGRVDQALRQLSKMANEAMARNIGADGPTVAFKQTEVDGLRVSYFAVPLIAPSWAIQDGNLYVGLYPQVVVGAAKHVTSQAPGLGRNEKYLEMRRRLGAPEGAAVQFIDMEARVPGGYASWLAVMRLYLGMADMWGVQSPVMFMPPLAVVMEHLSPAGSASWSDEAGAYMRSVQPFPGSSQLATTDMGSFVVGQQAMTMSILLPSLNRARETANRVKCASNMRQIGQAILLYGNENRGKYPPDLGTLLRTQDIGIEVFTCPSSGTQIPAEIRQAPVEQQAAWVNENADFAYTGAGLTTTSAQPDRPVLYELDGAHGGDGMNFLYGDGHVEFQNWPRAETEIERAQRPAGN